MAVGSKVNRRYSLKVVQSYASPLSYKAVDSFYENVEWAINKLSTQYTVVILYTNANDQAGEREVGGLISRGDVHVQFEDRNNLIIINTFIFYRNGHEIAMTLRQNIKWTFFLFSVQVWRRMFKCWTSPGAMLTV